MAHGFKAHGYKIVTTPEPVRFGKQSIKFEVRPGDCGHDGNGWSDCKNDRERHELSQNSQEQRHGDNYWYSLSIFIPEGTPAIHPTKVHLGQFHQRKKNVLWLMSWTPDGYMIDNQVPGNGRTIQTQVIVGSKDYKQNSDIKGRWIDILINVKWSHNNDGYFRVYEDHQLKYDWNGQTIAKGNRSHFKFGIYRSFISRYSNSNDGAVPPKQVIYYDEVHRGRSLSKVDKVGVAKLQEQLKAEGLYAGAVDGLWGRNTRSGLNKYLSNRGQPEVQEYSMRVWQLLGEDTDFRSVTEQPRFEGKMLQLFVEFREGNIATTKEWQSYLRHVGFYTGSVDGSNSQALLKSVRECVKNKQCKF